MYNYDKWKEAVFEKDGYECMACGHASGKLHAQHITNYGYNPHLRVAVENGVTLCEVCHANFHHMYGPMDDHKKSLTVFCKCAGEILESITTTKGGGL